MEVASDKHWLLRLRDDLDAPPGVSQQMFADFAVNGRLVLKEGDPRLDELHPWRTWFKGDWDEQWARLNLPYTRPHGKWPRSRTPQTDQVRAMWRDSWTDLLLLLAKRWGPHCFWHVSDAIKEHEAPEVVAELEDAVRASGTANSVMRCAEEVAAEIELPLSLTPPLNCLVCGLATSPWLLHPSMMRRFDSVDDFASRPIGPDCFRRAFGGGPGRRVRRIQVLKSRLQELAAALSGLPPANYLACPDLWAGIPPDRSARLVAILVKMPSPDSYKAAFGSWLGALEAAGLLTGGVRPTSRGVQCLAKDGHVCFSLGEKMIDDWLHDRGIQHEREPLYPAHGMNPRARLRADWSVGGVLIEYFGLAGDPEYDAKIARKTQIAREHGVELVGLYQRDLYHLDVRLAHLLPPRPETRP